MVRDLPVADLHGVVVDATTLTPLTGVQVKAEEATTSSDSTGRYRLRVSQGVRAVTYALPDRSPVRKYVVVLQEGEIQLDLLYPPSGAPPRPARRLVLQRGLASHEGKAIPREAGDNSLVSISDELGNDENFLALGHGGYSVYSPVWDPSGGAIFY